MDRAAPDAVQARMDDLRRRRKGADGNGDNGANRENGVARLSRHSRLGWHLAHT